MSTQDLESVKAELAATNLKLEEAYRQLEACNVIILKLEGVIKSLTNLKKEIV